MPSLYKYAGKQMSLNQQQLLKKDDVTLQALLRAVVSVLQVGYGSIEVTVHEGRITQIEKREKLRIAQDKSEKQKRDMSTGLQN